MTRNKNRKAGVQRKRDDLWLLARHDFRQPAQSLELLSAAMASARTAEERRACAVRVAQVAGSLRRMEECLTPIARLESGDAAPTLAPVALSAAIEEVQRRLGRSGEPIEQGETKGTALVDAAHLRMALNGMMLYALRTRDSGSVQIATQARGAKVAVGVTFEGTHPPTATTRMAFVELPPLVERDDPAVGPGPALVSRLAAAAGWRLLLTTTGRGTARIALSLPAAPRM